MAIFDSAWLAYNKKTHCKIIIIDEDVMNKWSLEKISNGTREDWKVETIKIYK